MNVTRLTLAVDSTQVRRASTELHGMQRRGQQAEKAVTRMGHEMASAAQLATRAFIALGATLSARELIQYSDAWTQVNNQIRQVTNSEQDLIRVRNELFRTAQDTNSELEVTTRLYTEMYRATRDLNVSQRTVAEVTRTINNLFLAGGKAASETAGAVRQLTQGLAAGALRGDEFNSVAEGAPRVLDAIAEHLGMARGELREFAATGGITAEILIGALREYSDEAQRLADMTEETFGQKMVRAQNNMTAFAGESRAVNAAIGALGDGVVLLTEGLVQLNPIVDNLPIKFRGFAEDAGESIVFVSELLRTATAEWEDEGEAAVEILTDAFVNMPENIRAAIQLATVEIAALVDHAAAYGKAFAEVLGSEIGQFVLTAQAYGKEIADALNPFDGDTFNLDARLAELEQLAEEMKTAAFDAAQAKIDASREARRSSIEDILAERDTAVKAYQDQVSAARKMLNEFTSSRDEIADTFEPVSSVLGDVANNLEDMGKEGVKAFRVMQRSMDEGSRSYRNLEVAIQAANVAAAVGAVLNQGNGDPYTAFARMATMAAAVASLGYAVGNLSGGASSTAQDAQAAQGTGTVLGAMTQKTESIANATEITANATQELVGINRGMLSALQSLRVGIEGATRQIAGNFQISPSVFTTNAGISLGGGRLSDLIDSPSAESFSEEFVWGDLRNRQSAALGADAQQQISGILESIAESVGSGAVAIGLAAGDVERAIREYEVRAQQISLVGLTPEEQQAELEAVFGSIFDGLAGSVVPFIDDFQRMGEGLGETLARVATNVQVTEEAILQLGFTAERTSVEQFARLSTALIDAAGGMDQFISGMGRFVNSFADEEHKLATLQSEMERAFAQVNLQVPESRDAMWDLMQTLDAGTEAGRAQIAALLELSDVADEYYKQLEESQREATQEAARVASERERLERQLLQLTGDTEALRALELAALDESNRALQERIWALQDEQAAVAEFTAAVRSELSGISGALATLRGQADPAGMRSSAVDTLRNALLTGDLTGTGQAAQIAAQLNANDFTSSEEFRREQARTVFLLDSLEREGNQQISTAEQSLNVLESIDGGIDQMVESLAAFVRSGASGNPIESTAPIQSSAGGGITQRDVSELVREIQDMKRYIRQTTKNTGETRDQLERWNRDGLPEERDYAL